MMFLEPTYFYYNLQTTSFVYIFLTANLHFILTLYFKQKKVYIESHSSTMHVTHTHLLSDFHPTQNQTSKIMANWPSQHLRTISNIILQSYGNFKNFLLEDDQHTIVSFLAEIDLQLASCDELLRPSRSSLCCDVYTLRYNFSSNHNIHKSFYGLCFCASDPLSHRFQ